MCGGIGYRIDKIPKKELKKYYDDKQIRAFEDKGEFQSFFWSKQPLLPIEEKGQVELKEWGNRDKNIKLPQTGWAKAESINEGKWAYLKPDFVKIVADRGYEKGVWFSLKKEGFQGVKVSRDDLERVYMITKPADEKYLRLTKHNRQPEEI